MPETDFDRELLATNLLGATTLEELYQREKIVTHAKMIILHDSPLSGALDYTHLKEIHRFLFEDVYTWAGKDRYESGVTAIFAKGTTLFTAYDKVPSTASILFDSLKKEHFFTGQDRKTFVKSAALFMNGLNILHPFREGNGRVQRIFMQYLAQNAGYTLYFDKISAHEMVQASIEGAMGRTLRMEKIFDVSLRGD
jgi:cell filamentation protein